MHCRIKISPGQGHLLCPRRCRLRVYLGDKFVRVEVTITILAWFENNASLFAEKLITSPKKKTYTPVVIVKASPFGGQEIRDHERLAFTFWFGGRPAVLMASASLPFIVLKECGFVVYDEDEVAIRLMTWNLKGVSIIIPKLETGFVICPSVHERTSIGHNIFSLMAINKHSFFHFLVVPIHF